MTPFRALALLLLAVPLLAPPSGANELPAWAYPVISPDYKPAPDGGTIRRVPGSTVGYTLGQVRNLFAAPDWHPNDHPKMPAVVANGRMPAVYACGFCHRASGPGGPENANLAGLPYAYIVQQMADYKSGARSTALPKRLPQAAMIALSKQVTDEEVKEAAAYFSSLKPRANIRVVETATVPRTVIANWFWADARTGEKEPIGRRIVETPEDVEHFELRDARATFVAYVPPGSLARGEALVTGKVPEAAPACAACHGPDLRGTDAIPPIAGRSPSYVMRQLYEMQAGIRAGQAAVLMKPVVEKLGLDDMIAVAAYLASRAP